MDTDTREQRISALDQFAKNTEREPGREMQKLPTALTGTVIHGSIDVVRPRNTSKILQELRELAAAMGDDWYYRFPVKDRKSGGTSYIEGPSTKLAHNLARIYGNCDVSAPSQDMGDYWLFRARFIDLETGFALERDFQQRKSASRLGGDDDGRRLEIAHAIGAAKATRNVIVNALTTFADFAFEEAKGALVDKIGKDLANFRDKTAERISAYVDLARVEAVVGRVKADWLAPDIAKIIAMMRAVNDGWSSMDETFPPLGKTAADTAASTAEKLDAFAQGEQDSGAGEGASRSADAVPHGDQDKDAPNAAGAGEDGHAHAVSPAEVIHRLRERLADATDVDMIQEIWDQLDVDGRLAGDNAAKSRASKAVADRKRELGLQ